MAKTAWTHDATVGRKSRVNRDTITRLEQGAGATRLDVFLNVARALGLLDNVVKSIDPYETPLGRARADEALPQRVR